MKLGKLHIRAHHLPHIAAGMFALVMLLGSLGPFAVSRHVSAEQVALRSLKISDSTVSATGVKYTFTFNTVTSGPVGSIQLEICTNYIFDPNIDTCNSPPGFDGTGATLTTQSGTSDFVMDPASTSHQFLLTRPVASNLSPQQLSYEFSGITNPSDIGTIYGRVATYASTDGTGPETDYGTMVASMNEDITIMTEVPPYLLFCTGVVIAGLNCGTADGNFISFGELSVRATRAATSQYLVATNAPSGYSITLDGTTLMAGNNVIPAMSGEGSQFGVSQFGMNARANSGPAVGEDPSGPGFVMPKPAYSTPNSFRFNRGDIISAADVPDDYRKTTVSYVVNRSPDQAAGRYVATITYICLGNF
jgi:hypothetical protein